MPNPEKYQKAELPANCAAALQMAEEREFWAKEARERDQHGSAREFELMALLLRSWASARALLGGSKGLV